MFQSNRLKFTLIFVTLSFFIILSCVTLTWIIQREKWFQDFTFFSDSNLNSEIYLVTKVIDGDTIEVTKNSETIKVRYIGVDTPESVKPNTPVQCYAKEASRFNESLVLNKKVWLESDAEDTDRYGRKLRYVYLADTNEMVNEVLIREGYAQLLTIPPNVKYVDLFRDAETNSRKEKRGLWGECR